MHPTNYEPFVIISACTKNQFWRSAMLETLNLKKKIQDLGYIFKVVYGKFEGKTETSLYVPYITHAHAQELAKEFGQKSWLSVNKNREAELVHVDGIAPEYLGWFIKGESEDNYTIDEGIKYICTGVK